MVYFTVLTDKNMLLLLLVHLVHIVHASTCPPAPRIIHPAKGIGLCNGTCHDIACVGYKAEKTCFHWECKDVPHGVTVRIPPPYDTIHAKYEASLLSMIFTFLGLCTMFILAPQLTIGILIGTAIDDDYEFDS